jgi:hypothetical protein
MRKLYEATGGQPQRWESLGNLGAVKSDAADSANGAEAIDVLRAQHRRLATPNQSLGTALRLRHEPAEDRRRGLVAAE